jgi:purine-cytosine permease-like protein
MNKIFLPAFLALYFAAAAIAVYLYDGKMNKGFDGWLNDWCSHALEFMILISLIVAIRAVWGVLTGQFDDGAGEIKKVEGKVK